MRRVLVALGLVLGAFPRLAAAQAAGVGKTPRRVGAHFRRGGWNQTSADPGEPCEYLYSTELKACGDLRFTAPQLSRVHRRSHAS